MPKPELFRRCAMLGTCALTLSCDSDSTGPSDSDDVIGSGVSATEVRPVSGFSAVQADGVALLLVDRTGAESLTVTADDNILPLVETEVVDGTLILRPQDGVGLEPSTRIIYQVTAAELDAIELSGVIEAEATGLDTDRFDVTVTGVSQLTAQGQADRHFVTVTGVTNYFADALETAESSVVTSGVFTIWVWARDRLDVFGCGIGSVEYVGDPVVDIREACLTRSVRRR